MGVVHPRGGPRANLTLLNAISTTTASRVVRRIISICWCNIQNGVAIQQKFYSHLPAPSVVSRVCASRCRKSTNVAAWLNAFLCSRSGEPMRCPHTYVISFEGPPFARSPHVRRLYHLCRVSRVVLSSDHASSAASVSAVTPRVVSDDRPLPLLSNVAHAYYQATIDAMTDAAAARMHTAQLQ